MHRITTSLFSLTVLYLHLCLTVFNIVHFDSQKWLSLDNNLVTIHGPLWQNCPGNLLKVQILEPHSRSGCFLSVFWPNNSHISIFKLFCGIRRWVSSSLKLINHLSMLFCLPQRPSQLLTGDISSLPRCSQTISLASWEIWVVSCWPTCQYEPPPEPSHFISCHFPKVVCSN